MTFSEIRQKFSSESEASLRRWVNVLKREGVLSPTKGPGNEDIFSEEDYAKLSHALSLGKRGVPRPQVALLLKEQYPPEATVLVRLKEENDQMLRTIIDMAMILRRAILAPLPTRMLWALRPTGSPHHEAMTKLLRFLETYKKG